MGKHKGARARYGGIDPKRLAVGKTPGQQKRDERRRAAHKSRMVDVPPTEGGPAPRRRRSVRSQSSAHLLEDGDGPHTNSQERCDGPPKKTDNLDTTRSGVSVKPLAGLVVVVVWLGLLWAVIKITGK